MKFIVGILSMFLVIVYYMICSFSLIGFITFIISVVLLFICRSKKRSEKDRKAKKIIGIILLIASLVIQIILLKPNHNGLIYLYRHPYNKVMKYKKEDLGDYEKLEFRVRDFNILIFRSIGTMYVATYNDENYLKQKEILEKRKFLEEPIRYSNYSERYEIPQTEIKKNNWLIKIEEIENRKSNYDYADEINMIGFNDDRKMIVYMSFEDIDQDEITDLDKLIDLEFNYDFK